MDTQLNLLPIGTTQNYSLSPKKTKRDAHESQKDDRRTHTSRANNDNNL